METCLSRFPCKHTRTTMTGMDRFLSTQLVRALSIKLSHGSFFLLGLTLLVLLKPSVGFSSSFANSHLCFMHTSRILGRTTVRATEYLWANTRNLRGTFRNSYPCCSKLLMSTSVTENGTSAVSSSAETYEIANDFSLQELQTRLQGFVDHPNHPGIVLAVAGGGGHLLSSLSSTPGASQVLLQASILYDRESYRRYIQHATPVSLEESPSFRYASIEASNYAAAASLKEALEISAAANTTYGTYVAF